MKNLKPEVAAKYVLVGIRPGNYNFKGFGEIDLSEVTLAKADSLFISGFSHFKLREGFEGAAPVSKSNLKARPLGGPSKTGNDQSDTPSMENLRKNKKLINKLLTMDWKDLAAQDRLIFFNKEGSFQAKKNLLNQVSENDRKMQGLHANLKALAEDSTKEEERAELMDELSELEETKLELFALIDAWEEPESNENDPQIIKEKAAQDAIAKQKLIAANENYIYRNEPALANMPESTSAEKRKKQAKVDEINRRKQELITLGKPYERKSRS